jgi:hypothetical protein
MPNTYWCSLHVPLPFFGGRFTYLMKRSTTQQSYLKRNDIVALYCGLTERRRPYRGGRLLRAAGTGGTGHITCNTVVFRSGAEGSRTPDLRRAKSRYYCRACSSLFKNTCKFEYSPLEAFMGVRRCSCGLVYYWCTQTLTQHRSCYRPKANLRVVDLDSGLQHNSVATVIACGLWGVFCVA